MTVPRTFKASTTIEDRITRPIAAAVSRIPADVLEDLMLAVERSLPALPARRRPQATPTRSGAGS